MRTPIIVAVACATLLAAVGCGGPAERRDGGGGTAQSVQGGEPAPTGRMVPRYADADTPEAQQGRRLMMDAKFLEAITDQVNDILRLPFDVPVIGKQCGEANAYWDPEAGEISMCYEDIASSYQMFADHNDPDPVSAAVNSEISTFYHELGHAILSVYELPFTGREEDVADQLSAFLLLAPGEDGKPNPDGVRIATDAARMWRLASDDDGDANDLPFWDSHSFSLTRMYNWECWIYGSDPATNKNIVTSGDLPEDRADGCEEEFQTMSAAWMQMLGPHLRQSG